MNRIALWIFFVICKVNVIFAQGLIINELSQGEGGNKEYVELLVVASDKCNVVDLKSWIIDDNNGDFGANGISRGYIKFTDDPLWSRIMSGTVILLWNVEDTSLAIRSRELDILDVDPNDFRIVIPVGCKNVGTASQVCPSSQYIVGVTNIPNTINNSYNYPFAIIATTFRWNTLIAFGNSVDAVQTRRPDGSFYFGLAYGTNNLHPESSLYGVNSLLFPQIANTYSLTNQFSIPTTLNNLDLPARDKRNWTTSASSRTPGEPNSNQNLEYIEKIMVDDDCTLNIRFPEESPIEMDPKDETIRYYNLLGQEVKREEIFNRVVIEERVLGQRITRRKIVVFK